MNKLPNKFTGYDVAELGFDRFKSLCYSLQALGILKVLELSANDYPKNYYQALVTDSNREFSLYMNKYTPVMSIGKITDNDRSYLDNDLISSAINNIDLSVSLLTKEELEVSVTKDNLDHLSIIEIKAIKHWLPSTVGELLFSWYFD